MRPWTADRPTTSPRLQVVIGVVAMGLAGSACGTAVDILPDRALESVCVVISDWNPNTTPGQARTSTSNNTTTFAQFEQDAEQVLALASGIRDAQVRGTMLALAGQANTFRTRVEGAIGEDLRYGSRNYEAERRVRADMRNAVRDARALC